MVLEMQNFFFFFKLHKHLETSKIWFYVYYMKSLKHVQICYAHPAMAKFCSKVGLMLVYSLWLWPQIKPTMCHYLVLAGQYLHISNEHCTYIHNNSIF